MLRPRRRAVLALVTINPATSDTTPYQILRAQGAWHFCRPRQKPPCPHRRACGAPLQTSARAHIRLPPRPDLPQLPQAWVAGKEPLHGARRPPAVSLATRMKRMVSQTSGSSPSSRACTPLAAPRAGARQPPRLPCWLLRRVRARSRGGGECTGAGVYSRAVRTPLHDAKLLTYVLLSVLLLLGPYLLRLRHAKQPAERGL